MGLFPQSFIEDLRQHADIVQVIQDYVPLKRAGTSFRGLCPFHAEKTPSFHVHRDRGFFHCFGCGLGGDVFKFLELHDKVGFQDAVRQVAARFGVQVPEAEDARRHAAADAEREALLNLHGTAAAWFREELAGPGGARARQQLRDRGVQPSTADRLGLGFAPGGRDGLAVRLQQLGLEVPFLLRSGLVIERGGQLVDRFRNRLMVPICRDTGSVIAFGGRAMDSDQQPKYLNSPETTIYAKGRTLYGLHVTRGEIRRLGYAVLVEGYFDLAQALQAGVAPVVALCGTALTAAQAQLLRRYATKVVLSFDPDAAGLGAAARSSELLVAEGFQVNVAVLPAGEDPDIFIRRRGRGAYLERLRASRPYLDHLLDRAAAENDLNRDSGRREFLARMLAVAARLPDPAARDVFADRIAHKARITEEVVRAEIRRAAVARRTRIATAQAAAVLRPAEKGLIWALIRDPEQAMAALAELDAADLEGLATAPILALARSLADWPARQVPTSLPARLSTEEAGLLKDIAAAPHAPALPADCVRALKRLRYDRERATVQREIDRLQEQGGAGCDREIVDLWTRKKDLLHRIEALGV